VDNQLAASAIMETRTTPGEETAAEEEILSLFCILTGLFCQAFWPHLTEGVASSSCSGKEKLPCHTTNGVWQECLLSDPIPDYREDDNSVDTHNQSNQCSRLEERGILATFLGSSQTDKETVHLR
jgi:hypothetical protein